jgi:MFS transporter, DHA1 family, multidrug resistance protein
VLSAALWGIGAAAEASGSAAYAADQAPPGGNGVTMGIFRMLSDLGYVVGPALLGLIADGTGAQTAMLTAAGFAAVAVVPFFLLAPETGGRRKRLTKQQI